MSVSVEIRHENEGLTAVLWSQEFEFSSHDEAETFLYEAGFYVYSCNSWAIDVQTQAVVFE